MLNNVSTQSANKKYVHPRHHTKTTEKTALKKEFSLEAQTQAEAFPTLSSVRKPHAPLLSFAQVAQTAPLTRAVSTTTALLPGWVYIRRQAGKIEYKSSDQTRYPSLESVEEADARLGRLLVKYRLAKAQYERDNDVLRLGDFSEYYNTPTLQEQFDAEDIALLKSEARSPDSSDTE
jgi:hypothetical protein